MGVGSTYSALNPTAIKWFPPEKTGLIIGIVIAGTGLAPLVLAPLCTFTLNAFAHINSAGIVEKGVSATMITLGIRFLGCFRVAYLADPGTTAQFYSRIIEQQGASQAGCS